MTRTSTRFSVCAALALCAAAPACDDALPPTPVDECAAPDPATPERFARCSTGSGSFGRWTLDAHGLPAFRYTADQAVDPRAAWETSAHVARTDHMFQLGNDRLIVVADNDGLVQIFHRDRFPTFLNRVNLEQGRSGGGYSLVAEDGEVWASAHGLRPPGATTERLFGMSHAHFETRHDGLVVDRQIVVPSGDGAFVIDDVTLRNESGRRRTLTHYEVWDVARHSLVLQLVRSGELSPTLPASLDMERDGTNRRFVISARRDGGATRVSHAYDGTPPVRPDEPSAFDYYPPDVFLERLVPDVEAEPPRVHTAREDFYGDGALAAPAAALAGTPPTPLLEPRSGAGHPAVLVDEVEVTLEAGESLHVRYAFGAAPSDGALPDLQTWRDPAADPAAASAAALAPTLARFATAAAPELHREAAWHAAQLLAATVFDECLGAHTVVQGSTYMYLHGLDGAARDFALFAIPLTYLRPDLARELLRTIMRLTHADGDQISYAVQGCGMAEDAVIHTAPSDLDLFFLWALAEYVAVTGDEAFLEEEHPFWPPGASEVATTREHAARALRHLVDQVGVGPHGLIRVRTGDWSDGILYEAEDQSLAEEQGESIPNTQMAAWVLPRAAGALFDGADDDLAAEARLFAVTMRAEAEEEWAGQWYRRAWFGPDAPYGEGHLDLEAQVWALIAGVPDPERRAALVAAIGERLDSPVGARRASGDMVWHAITGLLTWGLARGAEDDLAWESLRRHTLHAYATRNPDQWYGTWSGPDALGVDGGTWGSLATPMGDWPVMNANQHAMPLLALLRVAGVEPSAEGDGTTIAPRVPRGAYVLDLPALRLEASPDAVRVTWRAATRGRTTVRLRAPFEVAEARVDDHPVAVSEDGAVTVPLVLARGDEVTISLMAR